MEQVTYLDRRSIIKSIGGISVVGLAGCTGNGNGGNGNGGNGNGGNGNGDYQNGGNGQDQNDRDGDMILGMATATEGAAGQVGGSAIAAAVNEFSDNLHIEAVPTPGSEANVGLLEREEHDIALVNGYNILQVINREGPFESIGFDMTQTHHFMSTQWAFWAPEDRGIQSTDDIDSDTRVAISGEGAGLRPPMIRFLDHAVDDYELISHPHPDQLSAFQEGHIDVGIGPKINDDVWPAYVEEQTSVLDLQLIDFPEEALASIDDDPLINYEIVDPLDGWVNDPDEVVVGWLDYDWVARSGADRDAVYEMHRALYENREDLGDFYTMLNPHGEGNGEFFVNVIDSVPFHPGAADYWEEVDLWRDEFTRYDG